MEAVKPHGGSWGKARFSLQVNTKGIYYMKQHEVQDECILVPWYSPPVLLRIIGRAAASSWWRRRGRQGECYGNASPGLRCCKKFKLSNSSTKLSPTRYCKEKIKNLAQKLEVFLYSGNIKGHFHNKMILPPPAAAEGEYMNELIELVLGACHEIECLIDTMNHHHQQLSYYYDDNKTIFSNLLKLRLYDLPFLETLCYGQPPSGLFEKLQELLIINCHRLHSIVSSDKLINFCNLKYLQVRDCGNLESLFTSSTAQNMISLEVLKVKYCETMKHVITHEGTSDGDALSSRLIMFPKLKQVNIRRCYNMRCLMPASFANGLSRLDILKVKDAPALEYVFGEHNNDGMVQNLKIDLPVLKLLKLTNLPNIISIAPENYHVLCPSLERPHLRGCPNLISMFGLDLEESQQSDEEADTKQDLGFSTQCDNSMVEPALNMESNSEPEGLPHDYKSPVDGERCHDDDAEDKGEKEAEQSKVTEQSSPRCVESRELDEGSSEIEKGSLHNDPALEESKEGTSIIELIEKQPEVEHEMPLVLEEQQQALEEHKVNSPRTNITTTPLTTESLTSSSTNQHLPKEGLVDFHGLFKIKSRQSRLLEEAFIKYPHLWKWKLSQRTPRICKVGYKSLADMLAFLESETPKTMDDSKMEKFEKLYYELEYFGFDKMWLTSIRQRVMGMQADHWYKLKQLDQLESQISILEEQLDDARASLVSVKDDLSKPSHVYGF